MQPRLLLEEPAKVRSQVDCLSFSEDAGDCEEVSSVLGLMEAGGSETSKGSKIVGAQSLI